ncbi:MAG: class I SAM-dependent methyltransferase [Mycobacteriales bacterium]
MGWWGDAVLPRLIAKMLGPKRTGHIRERVCADLSGQVVELGFGSGTNAGFYPAAVTEVLAVEPSDLAWRLAEKKVAAVDTVVTRVGLDGQRLPLDDASVDNALSTWTLCTIPDAPLALAELRRVLRPGGRLHFVEHGQAPDPGVERWQHRLEPLQKRIGGGCHLSRPIADLLTDAGFVVEKLDRYYEKGEPKPFGHLYEGVAVSP